MSREPADESGGDCLVPRKLLRQLVRQALQGEREHAQTVETDDALLVNSEEDLGNVTALILGRAFLEPVIKRGDT